MRGAASAPPPPGPPLPRQQLAVRRRHLSRTRSHRLLPLAARCPALTVPHAHCCRLRRSRVSERARARALRPVAPGLGLRGPGGSGFEMLRRPRARAPSPASHTLGALRGGGAGRSGTATPGPAGRGGGSAPGRRVSLAQRACAGCHREATEGRSATPRPPRQPGPGVEPPGVGGGWDVQEGGDEGGENGCLGAGLGGAAWQCFPAPPLSLWRLSRAHLSLYSCGLGCDLPPRLTH